MIRIVNKTGSAVDTQIFTESGEEVGGVESCTVSISAQGVVTAELVFSQVELDINAAIFLVRPTQQMGEIAKLFRLEL